MNASSWLLLAAALPLRTAHALAAALQKPQTASYEDTWQATWSSRKFWDAFGQSTPDLGRPELANFRGLCSNLQNGDNIGRLTREQNGQTINEQYRFPGVSRGHAGVAPAADGCLLEHTPRMEWFAAGGLQAAAEAACYELDKSLQDECKPLLADHGADFVEERKTGDSAWNRMSWKGSQYLPLRSAENAWTQTTAALRKHEVPAAHRFCGISRQAAGCRGKVHSDHHNFVLSTLTPLRGCTAATGILLDGVETPILDGINGAPGATVLVDNTFDHQVYNDLNENAADRYVLIVEAWHPSLTLVERRAMSDLFALRDLFGLLEHKHAPFGVSDSAAASLLESGGGVRLDDWRLL